MLYLTILGQGRVELTWPDIMMGVIYNYNIYWLQVDIN